MGLDATRSTMVTIQQYMGVIKSVFCIVLVLNIVAAISIEEKKETEEFVANLFDPASGLFDEDTAEILWITCMEDLILVRKDIGDLGLCLHKESNSRTNEVTSEFRSTTRGIVQNLISTCNPQLKENFLNCLRKNNVPFQDQSKNWNTAYEGSGLSRRYPRRVSPRYLAEKQDKDGGNDGSSKKDKSDSNSDKSSKKKSSKSSKQREKAVYNAIAMTAMVAFIFAACIFLCCCGCCGSGRVNQTDERPLLSMSRSDYSVGT